MYPGGIDANIYAALEEIRKDLADLRDLVRGRPEIGAAGLIARIEASERRVEDLAKIQDGFVRDRDIEQAERKREAAIREKKEAARARLVAAALSVGGTLLVTLVIAVFKILVTVGTKAPP